MSELPFEGLLVHVPAQTGDGFLIFDPFESREACEQFGKTMGTLPQEVGITEGLKLFEAHTFLASCDSRHPAAT